MAFLIGGANSAADTGFSVDNSCRFNDGSSDDLTRTQDSTNPTNGYKYSFSTWIKRGALGAVMTLLGNYKADNEVGYIHFNANDFLEVYDFQGSGPDLNYTTDMKFKDISSWYNIVVSVDGTRSANARCKIYVNGSQVTCSSTVDTGGLLGIQYADATNGLRIGSRGSSGGTIGYLDGYMAETIYIDGEGLAPTDFGEFNSDSPTIWQPIDVSGLTFGNNGFYLDYEDSSALGADVSGNSNNLTVNNLAATDQTTDTPTNNFATLNPLVPNATTFSEGNTKFTNSSGANWRVALSTIAASAGKWYCEVKITEIGGGSQIGVADMNNLPASLATDIGSASWSWSYNSSDGNKRHSAGNGGSSFGDSFTTDDVMGIAMDIDNYKLYFAKNGTWQDSGDPTSGATGTGSAFDLDAGGAYAFGFTSNDAGTDPVLDINYGNPSYANSSDAADANGYGAFEYAPPSGYLALCTKNLGSDGG